MNRNDLEIRIGHRMRDLRREQGISQEELGLKVGLERSTISAYESENRRPTAYTAAKIAHFLGVSLDYLCGMTDIRYDVVIKHDVGLDMTKLNADGIQRLCEYYEFLLSKPEYLEEKSQSKKKL